MRWNGNKIRSGLVCSVFLISGWTGKIKAQQVGNIQATANVVSSLSIVGTNNLNFGSVTPGVSRSVDKAAVGFAGEWMVSGIVNSELSMTFALPDSLRESTSNAAMLVNFSGSDGSYKNIAAATQTAPSGVIDPNVAAVQRLSLTGTMDVWIGGTVWPSPSQGGGAYAADVILSVAYTGN